MAAKAKYDFKVISQPVKKQKAVTVQVGASRNTKRSLSRANRLVGEGQLNKEGTKLAQGIDNVKASARLGLPEAYYKRLALEMVNPIDDVTDAQVLAPHSTPVQVATRLIRSSLTISAADFPNGFRGVMTPDLFQPGFVQGKSAAVLPAAGSGFVSQSVELITDKTNNYLNCLANSAGLANDNFQTVPFQLIDLADSGAVHRSGTNTVVAGGSAINMSVTNTSDSAGPVQYQFYGRVPAGAWSTLFGANVERGAADNKDMTAVAGGYDAIGYTIYSSDTAHTKKGVVKISFSNAQTTLGSATALQPNFGAAMDNFDVSSGRVISMAVLVANHSDDLNKGGDLCIGRVPHNFNPFGDLPSQMEGLPKNRGATLPLATGGYAWWTPNQLDEFSVDDLAASAAKYSQSEYLVFGVPSMSASARLVLHFAWRVEFYTKNQAFEKLTTPPMLDEFRIFQHALLLLPAYSCNPDHKDLLGKFADMAKGAVNAGQKVFNHYQAHKDLYDAALQGFLSML